MNSHYSPLDLRRAEGRLWACGQDRGREAKIGSNWGAIKKRKGACKEKGGASPTLLVRAYISPSSAGGWGVLIGGADNEVTVPGAHKGHL